MTATPLDVARLTAMTRPDVEVSHAVEALRTCRVLVLDADGVWWDGRETRADSAGVWKTRDLRDGQGLSFIRALGIRVIFATAEKSGPLASVVAKLNDLPSVRDGRWAPVEVLDSLNRGKAVEVESKLAHVGGRPYWRDVVVVGDDRSDLEILRLAGLAVCPSDAQRCAVRVAHVRLSRPGGGGAVRELAELMLDARGVDEADLPTA